MKINTSTEFQMKGIPFFVTLFFSFFLQSQIGLGQSNLTSIPSDQEFDYSNSVSLREVSFWEPVQGNTGWIVIREDLDNNNISGPSLTQVWNSNGEKKPAAYASGNTARVSATFNIVCTGSAGGKFYAKAENPDGYNLPVVELIEFAGEWLYVEQSMDKSFTQDEVGFWEDFELTWYWSNDQAGPWVKVEKSSHPLYVTHDIPILVAPTKAFHTVIYLACKNAMGLNVEKAIVDAMYTEFMDQSVKKIGSINDMTYWRPINPAPEPACYTTAGLLLYEDSRCGAWARFFRDMICIQGIANSEITTVDWGTALSQANGSQLITDVGNYFADPPSAFNYIAHPDIPNSIAALFWVKNWTFNSFNNSKFFIHENDGNNVSSITLSNGNLINEAAKAGVAAQGNPDPQSFFADHGIVKYGTDYYDPSYGTPIQNTGNDWENTSLDGFGALFIYNRIENGMPIDYILMWNGYPNSNVQQTNINP